MRLVNKQLEFQKELRFQDYSLHQLSPLFRVNRYPYVNSDYISDCFYVLYHSVPIFYLLFLNHLLTKSLKTKS